MNNKRYQVVFTGRLAPGLDEATVRSNLVLDLGLSVQKAEQMLGSGRVTLKRYSTAEEAQLLAQKLAQAGAICRVEDHAAVRAAPAQGESSLITLMNRLIRVTGKGRAAGAMPKR